MINTKINKLNNLTKKEIHYLIKIFIVVFFIFNGVGKCVFYPLYNAACEYWLTVCCKYFNCY